jgi:protein-export chaperone SecB
MQDYSNEERGMPHIAVNAQYIKDFSFENPGAPGSLATMDKSPQIDLALDLNVQKLPEENYYEVEISISAKALSKQKTLFVVDFECANLTILKRFYNDTTINFTPKLHFLHKTCHPPPNNFTISPAIANQSK